MAFLTKNVHLPTSSFWGTNCLHAVRPFMSVFFGLGKTYQVILPRWGNMSNTSSSAGTSGTTTINIAAGNYTWIG